MAHLPSWVVGLPLAIGIALLARRAGSLSPSGALAASIVGTLAMAAGWSWGLLLIAYFVSSSLLSRYRGAEKAQRLGGRVAKGGTRDAIQVLANGGIFAGAAVGYLVSPSVLWQGLATGALSASAADTWATEIGTLSRATPRSILRGHPVPVGTSGAITLAGTTAGVIAAALLGSMAWLLGWPGAVVPAALVGGVGGCIVDSLLGASLQARRWCASCGESTEQPVHRCGSTTELIGGLRRLDNDGVNLVATIAGALLGGVAANYF